MEVIISELSGALSVTVLALTQSNGWSGYMKDCHITVCYLYKMNIIGVGPCHQVLHVVMAQHHTGMEFQSLVGTNNMV